ncbi:helix-turn-helix transcriptional regulator [Streptomyces sp. SL203]|nr:helix-turn-helix transcriptional regulator [Streptomyces sp. SL203]MCY1649245.1 helix-turn-helix transcriptional regulator [Streptomyces sp. SL203]
MGKILDALKSRFQTRDIPKTTSGRFNALMRKEKGNTQRVAERLGVSRRTVQRYIKGERKIDNSPKVVARLEKEVSKDHQPKVRAKAQKEAKQRGLTVETRARFGFNAAGGSTDDARLRRLTEDVPDHLVDGIFEALRNGDESEAQKLIAEGLAEEYFRTPGTEREGLDVEFTDIDYVELDWQN